jgi:putative peptidoglycan lipid II flippase
MSAAESEAKAAGASERANLVQSAGIVGLGTLLSRVLGLLRDMALAAVFPREATDAFFMAFKIPNALRQILGEGAVTSAVVPVLSERLEAGGDRAAQKFFASIRGFSLLALCTVTALGMWLAAPLTELFAAGFHQTPGQFERTVQFTRALFPYIFFMGTCALGMAALNAKRKFAVAAFAPGLLNVAFLIAVFAFPGPLARAGIDPAFALVIGALLGGVLQMLAQAPALHAIGYAGLPRFRLSDPHVRLVAARMVPLSLGIGVYYIDLVLSGRFLSESGPGAQSYFTWAMRLCDFPQGIFVMALSTAALPALSRLAARGDMAELRKTVALGFRLSLFVALPASVLLVLAPEPLVAALFQRGQFTTRDVVETSRSLWFQGAGVVTVALVRQAVPVFYALGDTKTPVWVSAVDLAAFVAIAFATRGRFGHVGVSAAVFGSSLIQMLLLVGMLHRKLGGFHGTEVVRSGVRILGASLVAGVAARALGRLLYAEQASGIARLGTGLAVGSAFTALFLLAAWGLRAEELEPLIRGLRRRLLRRR